MLPGSKLKLNPFQRLYAPYTLSSMFGQRQLTQQQLELAETRRQKRLQREALESVDEPLLFLSRKWVSLSSSNGPVKERILVKIVSWNLLAQCLIRRELFPNSDCLKAGQREPMLHQELFSYNADLLCLQEVDRLDNLLPRLDQNGYLHHYVSGRNKKHGCLIAFKSRRFKQVASRTIFYDEQHLKPCDDVAPRQGLSFRTRNVANLLALECLDQGHGIIVATTHLFWHPRYTYERARQVAILKSECLKFRADLHLDSWPCIVAGDFNCPPGDAAYSLLAGESLNADQILQLQESRVVHASVNSELSEELTAGDDDSLDPDVTIVGARRATPADGLLSSEELEQIVSRGLPLRSAYDIGLGHPSVPQAVKTIGGRVTFPLDRLGRFEPAYTSYTYYWKNVLDYIFLADPASAVAPAQVESILLPHREEDLIPGLPKKGICGSDHILLGVEVTWQMEN